MINLNDITTVTFIIKSLNHIADDIGAEYSFGVYDGYFTLFFDGEPTVSLDYLDNEWQVVMVY